MSPDFVFSSGNADYLNDPTGKRRFWSTLGSFSQGYQPLPEPRTVPQMPPVSPSRTSKDSRPPRPEGRMPEGATHLRMACGSWIKVSPHYWFRDRHVEVWRHGRWQLSEFDHAYVCTTPSEYPRATLATSMQLQAESAQPTPPHVVRAYFEQNCQGFYVFERSVNLPRLYADKVTQQAWLGFAFGFAASEARKSRGSRHV